MECEYLPDRPRLVRGRAARRAGLRVPRRRSALLHRGRRVDGDVRWHSHAGLAARLRPLRRLDDRERAVRLHRSPGPLRQLLPELGRQHRRLLTRESSRAATACGVGLEINALGLRKIAARPDSPFPMYPWQPFWEMAAEHDVSVIVNSDAHRPDDLQARTADAPADRDRPRPALDGAGRGRRRAGGGAFGPRLTPRRTSLRRISREVRSRALGPGCSLRARKRVSTSSRPSSSRPPVEPLRAHGVRSISDTATGSSPRCRDGSGGTPRRRGEAWGWTAKPPSRCAPPLRDGAQHLPRPSNGPRGGSEVGKVPEHLLSVRRPASPLANAVLDDERAKTRRTDPHAKARQLIVPDDVAPVPGSGVGDRACREADLVQRRFSSTVRHGGKLRGSSPDSCGWVADGHHEMQHGGCDPGA